jgi:F-type H+-transporting ATPase subunit epsilon
MNLVILTPGQKVFEGQVRVVNTPGTAGKIEILENHAPLVASLAAGDISVVTEDKKSLNFQTTGGFIEVLNNNVSILLDAVSK